MIEFFDYIEAMVLTVVPAILIHFSKRITEKMKQSEEQTNDN